MPTHITLDHPESKSLWEKSFKYNINVDSNHLTDTSSLRVPIFESGSLEILLIWRREFEKIWHLKDRNTTPANFITDSRILLNWEALEMFEAVLEAQIGSKNCTVTHFNNTMHEYLTSMCPTDVGEDITNWLLNICKPCHIKVKEFVTHSKEINLFPPFCTTYHNLVHNFKVDNTSKQNTEKYNIIIG